MKKVLLFNPRAAKAKPRIPNSVLQIAASIEGKYDWIIVDGNLEKDPLGKLMGHLNTGDFSYFGCTVMPGPQLKQAIPFTRKIHETFPDLKIIWGGYFASNQSKAVMQSGLVDAVVTGPGDYSFLKLLDAMDKGKAMDDIPNIVFLRNEEVVKTVKDSIYDQDLLPDLPYDKLNETYPINRYLGKTFLGTKTIAYHSSFGCPFTCSFCGIVPIYNGRWKGQSAEKIYRNIKLLKDKYGGNAIEFHDNNFFVHEKRAVEFAKLIEPENMVWWGEARIDTMDKYSDESLAALRKSGCSIIFFGAETGNDEVLKKMDKGGKQSGEQIKRFAARMKQFDIIPEYSFVLGTPAETPEKVMKQIDEDIAFISLIKEINPATEIIIYVYSPVPTEGSEMFGVVTKSGFRFPERLEDWLNTEWENFDLRKNPLTPWLTATMIDKIKNFETVLNAQFPTVSDIKLSEFQRVAMRRLSSFRYKQKLFKYPYELKALQKFWLKYRQPEIEGF